MSAETQKNKLTKIRGEFTERIRESLELEDWNQLEHWAKKWIESDPKNSSAFKWLARASVSLNQTSKAAYAYGRLLDFDSDNIEAKKFFSKNPSTLVNQPQSVQQKVGLKVKPAPVYTERIDDSSGFSVLSAEQRRLVSEQEFLLAETYRKVRLDAEAAAHFVKSFEWLPTKAAAIGVAQSLHRSHQGLEAIKFLRNQLFTYPDWIEGRLLLGKISHDIGHKTDAQREWQSVLELDPDNKEALKFLRDLLTLSV